MKRWPLLLVLALAGSNNAARGAFPGNGLWGIKPAARQSGQNAEQPRPRRRASPPLDIYPPSDPHTDNTLYGRGLTRGGGSAYQTNEYGGRAPNMSYGYWDGGFNPGGLYSFSIYPHFDRPGFTYWQGGY